MKQLLCLYRAVEKSVSRGAHNPKIAGSSPVLATYFFSDYLMLETLVATGVSFFLYLGFMTGIIITYDWIQEAYAAKGYPFITTGKYQPNYFGIRSKDMVVDEFNDIIGVAYLDSFGNRQCLTFQGTTKPGLYYLKNKLGNVKGTFIVQPGFHKDCWVPGLHNDKYSAMKQRAAGVFSGWRDADSDGQLDMTGTIYTDASGVNGHTTSQLNEIEKVGAYSAGCQVIMDDKEHAVWYNVGARAWELYKKSFSYALFQQK